MFTRKYLLCETLCHSVVNPPNNFKTMNNEINTLNRQKEAILLLDNYDSFTYNLLHVVKEQGVTDIEVFRNDEITLDEVERFDKIILSPGPGIPEEAGLLLPIIRKYAATKSILGVCLGHQAICAAFGARVTYAKQLMHGKQSEVEFDPECPLFQGCKAPLLVARYHSLAADPATMPPELKVTARTADGEVMAVQHTQYPIYGVQFHPESILTPQGRSILKNFMEG